LFDAVFGEREARDEKFAAITERFVSGDEHFERDDFRDIGASRGIICDMDAADLPLGVWVVDDQRRAALAVIARS